MNAIVLIVILLVGLPALAADADRPEGAPPERPNAEETVPKPVPPSTIDPGIQKAPPTVPSPESAVQPPVVDPKMAVDPETAPPASSPNIPQKTEPPSKPPR
jgi:hypothetical protein